MMFQTTSQINDEKPSFLMGTSTIKWVGFPNSIANLPDALQKMTNSLLVNVDIPIHTKRLKDYPLVI